MMRSFHLIFVIQGLSDDLLTLINQDQNGLSAELQEALYTNGYYDYSTANVDEWYVKRWCRFYRYDSRCQQRVGHRSRVRSR